MTDKISIRLSSPEKGNQVLKEVGLPVDSNGIANLECTYERIGDGISIRQWLMPGLWVMHEDPNVNDAFMPELTISGDHVSVVCYGSGPIQNISKESTPLSGTVEIRNAYITSIPGGEIQGKRMLIVFSKPFLSRLLQAESWIKNHDLFSLLGPVSGNCHKYFLELSVRQILNSMLSENLKASQKKYYFELKLKELFFILHVQPAVPGLDSAVPIDIQQKLTAAKAYLLANHAAAPTIKQLSRIISLNEFWLKQYFKIQFRTTIRSYMTTLRMEEAKSLLTGNYTVNEVAVRVGYKNVSHFIQIFKRTFGDTPRQWMYKHSAGREPVKAQSDTEVSI